MKLEKITYFGHSAVFFNYGPLIVAVDPWLLGNPLCPEQHQNPKQLDLIILTHGHADHAGDAVRLAKYCGSKIAATYELAMILIAEGVPESQVLPMNKGGSLVWENLKISLTNAFHSNSYDSAKGTIYAGEACGAVLSDGKTSIYHSGDTALFGDMSLIKEFHKPDYAFLPIGDRFTMNPTQAARAASLVGCRIAIPIHYQTFSQLTGTVVEFKKECNRYNIEALELTPGQTISIGN